VILFLSPCPKMETPMERMPIACVHCAKAKAKCDKKVCSFFTLSQFVRDPFASTAVRALSIEPKIQIVP